MSSISRPVVVILALMLVTTPAWAQTPANQLQGFSVVLVLGDTQEGGATENVPAAARAALADLKDFLPYRSYRVLDTAWVLASSSEPQTLSGRLQGVDEQSYEFLLERMPVVKASSLQVRFATRELTGSADRRSADRQATLKKQLMHFAEQLRRAEVAQNQGEITAIRQRMIETEFEMEAVQKEAHYSSAGSMLIDTSFTMSLGETVVVGTSRMRGGNKALIVLLTAATRGAKPRE